MIKVDSYYRGVERDLFDVFSSAIQEVCSKDYSPEQISAWLPSSYDPVKWQNLMTKNKPYIASIDGQIAGYADLQKDGYIDHFFVSARHQSQGVATALMDTLLKAGAGHERLYAHVSITARPFFEHKGFAVVSENVVMREGVELKNYIMERLV